MAILNCALCDSVVKSPVMDQGHTFCCHGCAQLYEILGTDEVNLLKSRPGVNWDLLRSDSLSTKTPSIQGKQMCSLNVEGIWCASCSVLITTVLKRVPGVVAAQVDYASSVADVYFDDQVVDVKQITDTVERLGYPVHKTTDGIASADRMLAKRFTIAAILSLLDMMVSLPIWFGYFSGFTTSVHWVLAAILWALSTPVVFWAGFPFLIGAVRSIQHRVPTMDLLISIGSVSAYVYSFISLLQGGSYLYFDTASLLISFLLLSRSLEAGAKQRASRAVEMLSTSLAKNAIKLISNEERKVEVSELSVDDIVVVYAGEIVPADGIVLDGSSTFDESVVNGEALPAVKSKGDISYAGTTCLNGRVVLRLTRVGADTVIGKTVSMVQAAQDLQNRRQKVLQRILNVFVPVVLLIGVLAFVFDVLILHIPVGHSILRSISVWVIACPCSLSIAAPLLTAGTISKLSRSGLLMRSPDFMERAKNIDTVVFDKTGTLTRKEFQLIQVFPNDDELVRMAASVEQGSRHPVGLALVQSARSRQLSLHPVAFYEMNVGRGVRGVILNDLVEVTGWDPDNPLPTRFEQYASLWEKSGLVVSVVRVNHSVRGIMAFSEDVRSSSKETIQQILELGKDVIMLSGDNEGPCQTVANRLGIKNWKSGQKPANKAEYIGDLQAQGRTVAFVGDGINDAAALVQSDLGIAIRSGSDIAMQSGHVILTGQALTSVPNALKVAEYSFSLLRLNLVWAITYNVCGIVLAFLGAASPAIAALAMALSSSFVLGNSLRILDYSFLRYALRLLIIFGSLVGFAITIRLGL